MSGRTLAIVILVVSSVFVGITFTACSLFMKFMHREKEAGRRHDEIHRMPPET